jgi:hypothetical protein
MIKEVHKKPPPRRNCAICSLQATIHSIEESLMSQQNTRGPVVCAMPKMHRKIDR